MDAGKTDLEEVAQRTLSGYQEAGGNGGFASLDDTPGHKAVENLPDNTRTDRLDALDLLIEWSRIGHVLRQDPGSGHEPMVRQSARASRIAEKCVAVVERHWGQILGEYARFSA